MFEKIYLPVDNSEYSNEAASLALKFAQQFDSTIVGCHVYAAKMHDYRFKQMEFTLPEEYLIEDELERQRKIHDSLITMGLELISDSYLDPVGRLCDSARVKFERRMMDGKHHTELLKDIEKVGYDLTVLGALGMGKTRYSQIGSVCERIARFSTKDVLVVKHVPKDREPERDTIVVGLDGSPQSFGALDTAIELAKRFDKRLELVSVYDPYLHYAVFNGIVDVLSEKAAKVFRFEEQNQLHEEVIDTGLAQIYQSHLNVGEAIAAERGVSVTKTLLDGKAFHKILDHVEEVKPWLLVVGKIGVHSPNDEPALGSNSENLLRLADCNILLNTRLEYPELDLKAEETILWTSEAEERMLRVPSPVRGIARRGILRLAIEEGHSVITNSVIEEAMERFMPKRAQLATNKLAKQLVLERVQERSVWMCRKCGTTPRAENPAKCAVCGSVSFDEISPEVAKEILSKEGEGEVETTYDGKKLRWSTEARKQLLAIDDKYQKRRAKARIEKAARMKRIGVISADFARAVIEDAIGKVLFDGESSEQSNGHSKLQVSTYTLDADKLLIAVDEQGGELRSVFSWTKDAAERLLRVPAGFMRERNQERVENLALDRRREEIDLALVEEALELGRRKMVELLQQEGFMTDEQAQQELQAGDAPKKCPFSSILAGESVTIEKSDRQSGPVSHVYRGAVKHMLNEVGVMSELKKRRESLQK